MLSLSEIADHQRPAVTFVGRALGMAIFHRRFVDAHFATSIYKACLDRPIGLEDMALVDAEMFRALTWMA
jgi:E3 ubiquitin-protein ligase NEDD4